MKRVTTAVLAGVTVATLAYASASVLTVDSKPLQAGSDTVTCDADGVGVEWALETDDNSVYWATVTGIDDKCAGATLFVAVNGERLTQDGTPITANSHQVRFADRPSPESINDVKVWIG
jgi:hypothetical protein